MGVSSIELENLSRIAALARSLVESGDLTSLDRNELLPALKELEDLKRFVAVLDARLLYVIDEIGLSMVHGATSTPALLRQVLQVSSGEAWARTRAATDLAPRMDEDSAPLEPVLPRTADALAEAAIGVEHAAVIQRFIHRLSPSVDPVVKAEAEAILAERARAMDPQQLRVEAKQLQARIDPASGKADDEAAQARRTFTASWTKSGTLGLKGELPADAGETLLAALDPLAAPIPTRDGIKDPRTPGQRYADALIELASRQVKGGELPDNGGVRPTLYVTMTFEDLKGDNGIAYGTFGGRMCGNIARKIACDAAIVPAVLNSKGVPMDVGRARRTIPTGIRHALRIRDRGCAFPGCDRPAEWTDGHHVKHWARGGKTSLDNCCLLCPHHHSVIHREEWDIVMIGGRPWFRPPAHLDPERIPIRNTLHQPTGV